MELTCVYHATHSHLLAIDTLGLVSLMNQC